jgi:hypothetical protein
MRELLVITAAQNKCGNCASCKCISMVRWSAEYFCICHFLLYF